MTFSMRWLWLCLLLLPFTSCHVSLTFPQARFPPLDFLDTTRTMGPCGVPKPRRPHYTTLVVGETYEFTWRMQYPHMGGYRLTLLDSNGTMIDRLAPVNGIDFSMASITSSSDRVRFSRACSGCTVLLERQASEWGRAYQFRSCADVHIVDAAFPDPPVCNKRGKMVDGRCNCEPGFTGDVCQYLAQCQSDADCENNGKCVTEKDSLVRNTCFCAYGFFGRNCEKHSPLEDKCFSYSKLGSMKNYSEYGMFDPSCYNRVKLNKDDLVYYRRVRNDVEVILDFSTTSWLALGWRPEGLDTSCRLFPDLEGVTSTRARRESVQMPPLTPSTQKRMKNEKPVTIQQDELDRELEQQQREQESSGVEQRREEGGEEEVAPLLRFVSKVEQEAPRPLMPDNNNMLASALEAPLHAMDCVDMIAASVEEGRLRVQDLYSRDRSTPLEDEWFDGEHSLSAAAGIERDGRTVVMWRRNVQEIEPTDHPLGPGAMHVVWAKGQTRGAVSHRTSNGLKPHSTFYPDDQMKYHGDKNRGATTIDFLEEVVPRKHNDVAFGVSIAARDKTSAPSDFTPPPYSEPQPDSSLPISHNCLIALVIIAFF